MNQEYKDGDILSVPEYAQHFGLTEWDVWNRLQNNQIFDGRVSSSGELTAVMRAKWTDEAGEETEFGFIRLPAEGVRRVLGWTGEADHLAWTLPDLRYTFRAHEPRREHIHVMLMRDNIEGEQAAPPATADKAEAQDKATGAPTSAAPPSEPKKGAIMTRAGMIAAHAHEWESIKSDLDHASENGLSAAAKAGKRRWFELSSMEWARSNGKLKNIASAGHHDVHHALTKTKMADLKPSIVNKCSH